jgi:ribulose-phosphate 3-epimerase
MVKIVPSILAADFVRLGQQIEAVATAGADWIHCDIMDGHFVPNISFGPLAVEAANRATDLPLDVHLMIEEPDQFIEAFREAGADHITVQAEACIHLNRTLTLIKETGATAGVAINPATPIVAVEEVLDLADLILVMTVNPGFGGQEFIHSVLDKIRRVAEMIRAQDRPITLEVDGGIDAETAPLVVAAGARALVAGSSIFSAPDPGAALKRLRERALAAFPERT